MGRIDSLPRRAQPVVAGRGVAMVTQAAKTSLALLLATAACAPITLSSEVDDLQKSAAAVSSSMVSLEREAVIASAADGRAAIFASALSGNGKYDETCSDKAAAARHAFDASHSSSPYSAAQVDSAFRGLHRVPRCDLQGAPDPDLPQGDADLPELLPAKGTIDGPGSVGSDTLGGAGRALGQYIDALADLTTNKTGAGRDEARDGVFEAGGALLAAAGIPVAGPVAGMLGQIVASIEAARQNRRIAEYLTAYDRIMPHVMERLGHAGRLTVAQALESRAAAASLLATSANQALAGTKKNEERSRVLLFTAYDARIQAENARIVDLRSSDPMAATRAFSAVHSDLTAAFLSPKASRASLANGLDRLRKAAKELAEALDGGE